jgi:hypothetical protein
MAVMLWGGMLLASANAQNAAQNQPQSQAQQSQALGDYARSLRNTKAQAAPAKKFDNDNLPMNDKLSVVGPAPEPDQPAAAPEPAKAPEPAAQPEASKTAQADAQAQTPPPPGTDPESLTKPSAPPAPAQPATADAPKADTTKADAPKADNPEPAKADATKSESRQKAAEQQKDYEAWQKKIADQKDKISLISRDLDVTQREYHLRAAAFAADAGNRLRNSGSWDQEDTKFKQQIEDKQKELESAKQQLDDMQEGARKSGVPSSMRE